MSVVLKHRLVTACSKEPWHLRAGTFNPPQPLVAICINQVEKEMVQSTLFEVCTDFSSPLVSDDGLAGLHSVVELAAMLWTQRNLLALSCPLILALTTMLLELSRFLFSFVCFPN